MARLDEMDTPKKPTQLPPNPADDVGTHQESDFNDDDDVDEDDDALETPDDDTSDFE